MLRGPLVIQTFGAHYTAIVGAKRIMGVNDPNEPLKKAIGGLGLAATAVSESLYDKFVLSKVFKVKCALTLIKDGVITKESINKSWPKPPILPKAVNINTGKESSVTYGFNDDKWSTASRGFTQVAARVAESIACFEKIELAAKEHMKKPAGASQQDDVKEEDEFVMLVNSYDSGDDSE